EIVNYSIFNLAGHPTMVNQSFLPLNTRLITERTLFANLRKDVGWKLTPWYPFKWLWARDVMGINTQNLNFVDLVKRSATEKNSRPRFFYAHFYMPHIPYYFDKNGHLKDLKIIAAEYKDWS